MPITMPMPKSYVSKFDAKRPNKYETDPTVQAFSGPYMISDYEPGRSMTLVRNPNWDPDTDSARRTSTGSRWTFNGDVNVIGRQILNGTGLANGDTPAAGAVQRFQASAKDRISFTPLGNRFVPMNTQYEPFKDINVRKALIAATDRRAMQLTRGGKVTGDIATHFLPPGIPGFEEAGGAAGPPVDYLAKPTGDAALAAEYVKKAGFASGKYSGAPDHDDQLRRLARQGDGARHPPGAPVAGLRGAPALARPERVLRRLPDGRGPQDASRSA